MLIWIQWTAEYQTPEISDFEWPSHIPNTVLLIRTEISQIGHKLDPCVWYLNVKGTVIQMESEIWTTRPTWRWGQSYKKLGATNFPQSVITPFLGLNF